MNTIITPDEMRQTATQWKQNGGTVGLVPTMGFLHEGHLSLMRIARKQCDRLVVSIFVNPTQFAPNEDFEDYPRDFERDCRLCQAEGVDTVFAPDAEQMYPPDASTWVIEETLSRPLCGRARPTHFRGVTTVVAKLFNICAPDVAVFGQKDAQQALIIQRMVRDLNVPVRILIGPIHREADGLAMSSRNTYLSADERQRARSISQGLNAALRLYENGERSAPELRRTVAAAIEEAGGVLDYVELVSRDSLRPLQIVEGQALLAVAAYFGRTRLIDNVFLD